MAYLDTSILVAYYCPEPLSEAAEKVLRRVNQPSISALAEVEFVSALSRKMREKTLDREDARRILIEFESHLNQLLFKRIPLERDHYTLAYSWLSQFAIPLRTLDALHLAVASKNSLEIITADRGLAQSAAKLGLLSKLVE
jgi:uncharacterized protein